MKGSKEEQRERSREWLLREAESRAKGPTQLVIACAIVSVIGVVLAILLFEPHRGWGPALQLGGLALSLFGTCFLAAGHLLKERHAVEMSATKWAGNPDVLASLMVNRIAATIGLIFLGLGFALQGGLLAF